MARPKWEPGDTGRTRGGCVYVIGSIADTGIYRIEGMIFDDGDWRRTNWLITGRCFRSRHYADDLMPPNPKAAP